MKTLTAVIVLLMSLVGCTWPVYPVTSGFHASTDTFGLTGRFPAAQARYAVWSNHSGVSVYITGLLLQMGYTVVERARLQQIFDEQRIRLIHSPDDDANVLRVGRLAGAAQVIFAEVIDKPAGYGSEGHYLSVTVRSVHVETGEVRWSGTATTTERIMSPPDSSANYGAHWAIMRAICRVEAGYRWEDPSSSSAGGCLKKE